jgi:predicted Fe-Mo cluster-binding NifX family protein
MKVAFMTNNETTIAKHIGLAKKIALYQLPEGKHLQTVQNPIMQMIEAEGIELHKEDEGKRHLHVGHIIPQFLQEYGVDVFVSYEFGKGVKDNLLALGISPLAVKEQTIQEVIKTMQENQE